MAEPLPLQWHDLAEVSRRDTLAELLLPLPWAAVAALSGGFGFTPGLVAGTVVVFMIGVRLNHGAIHGTLGLSKSADDVLIAAISVFLGGATHVLAHTHRIHHRRCLAEDDLEGRAAAYGFWQALWRSPLYPLRIHFAALRDGSRGLRCWIVGELAAVVLVQALVWGVFDSHALRVVSATLFIANGLVPMVGIWAVHRGCHGTAHAARTTRSRALELLAVSMLFHDEHHRFPSVPTRRLSELARRLDAAQGRPTALCVLGRGPRRTEVQRVRAG